MYLFMCHTIFWGYTCHLPAISMETRVPGVWPIAIYLCLDEARNRFRTVVDLQNFE